VEFLMTGGLALARALAIAVMTIVASTGDPQPVGLFTAMPFDSWKREGAAATFSLETGGEVPVLVGTGKDLPANSFLTSPRPLGDFSLEVEVRIEPGTNSGIQLRSRVEGGRVRGPQVEIDPTPRAWSGGIYDEGDRGWMQSLEGREEARKAFTVGAWNRYRIECDGPRIRTWVNGVPCADWLDAKSIEGLVAFQVHSGPQATVSWRNPTLAERGRHAWTPLAADPDASHPIPPEAAGLRIAAGPWSALVLARNSQPELRIGPDGRILEADGTAAAADELSLDVLFAGGRIAVHRNGRPVSERDSAPPVRLRFEPPNRGITVEILRPAPSAP
jgi:hypothetical protein